MVREFQAAHSLIAASVQQHKRWRPSCASTSPRADRIVLLAPNGRDHVQRARHSRRRSRNWWTGMHSMNGDAAVIAEDLQATLCPRADCKSIPDCRPHNARRRK
jgi:hypothetical protein